MKFFVESLIVMGLVAVALAAPTTSDAESIEPINHKPLAETSLSDEKLQPIVATREKRGLLFSSAYTAPVAYTATAAYSAPIAYTSAYSYPYAYSAAYPYYAAAYSSPYYVL